MKKYLLLFFGTYCLLPTAAAQCRLPMDISLDSTANLLWAWHLQTGKPYERDSYRKVYDRLKKNAANPMFDSLFQVARQHLVDRLGEETYCNRMDMDLWYATKFYRMMAEFEFRFFIADIDQSKKGHFKKYRFQFQWDEKTGGMKQAYFPEVLDCRNDPSRCQFMVTDADVALRIAEEKGLIGGARVFSRTASNQGWTWEIEIRLNDDCLAQKVLVDMYTGEASVSDTYSWFGCTPLAQKVSDSPIVIEGTVVADEGRFKTRQGIWSSRLVEVNRIFKGELPTKGVLEVVALGGDLGGMGTHISHGQISLPAKGATAVFYLRSPWDEGGPTDGRTMDSLSAYPVFYAHRPPLVLYPNHSDKLSFHLNVEHNTYRAIELATGTARRNVRLPAVPDSAFAHWAVNHLRQFPVREPGLEYRVFKNHGNNSPDTLRLFLGIRSPASHSCLTRSKVVLRYSPAAFGDSIVAKGKLRLTPRFRTPHLIDHTFSNMLPPDTYRFEARDLSDSTFQIEITRPDGEGPYFQVTPFSYSKVLPALPIALLEIPVADTSAVQALDFVEGEMQDAHFHFDFEKEEEMSYFFVWPNDAPDFLPERRR